MITTTTGIAVGRCIRRERRRAMLSQQELADELGVSKSCVTLWENGKRSPTLAGLLNLADVLGVPPGALLPATEPPGTLSAVLAEVGRTATASAGDLDWTARGDTAQLRERLVQAAAANVTLIQAIDRQEPQ